MKTTDNRANLFDIFILSVCLVTLAGCVYLLLDDSLLTKVDEKDLIAVGQFSASNNDVRRKITNGFAWNPAHRDHQVFEGDSIFTGDNSAAEITLNTGEKLIVDPNSLIVVRTVGQGLEVDLQYGSLLGNIRGDGKLFLVNYGRKSEISGDGAELRITKAGFDTQIQVLAGTVQVDSGSGNRRYSKNQATRLELAGTSTDVKVLPVELMTPERNGVVWMGPSTPTVFSWASAAPSPSYKVEIASDSAFRNIIHEAETPDTRVAIGTLEKFGTFFWRVRAAAEDGTEEATSVSQRFTVRPDIPPQLYFPKDKQRVVIPADAPEKTTKLVLAWRDPARSTHFKVQLATDPEFQDTVLNSESDLPTLRSPNLEPNVYYWRVQGLHPSRETAPWSRTHKFTLLDGSIPVEIPPPAIQNPTMAYEFPREYAARGPASAGGIDPENLPLLTWQPVEGATGYDLELARNEDFSDAEKIQVDDGSTSYQLQTLTPGILHWRVTARIEEGPVSDPSAAGRVDATLPSPETVATEPIHQEFQSEEEMKAAQARIDLKWEPIYMAQGYEVQWSHNGKWDQAKSFHSKQESKTVRTSAPQTYQWRVRALDEAGRPISAFSDPQSVDYQKTLVMPPPPEEPVPVEVVEAPTPEPAPIENPEFQGTPTLPRVLPREPVKGTPVVAIAGAPIFVTLKWKPVKEANLYLLEMARDANFSDVVFSDRVRSNVFIFDKDVPSGRVYWRVRAINKKSKEFSDWSQTMHFNVRK